MSKIIMVLILCLSCAVAAFSSSEYAATPIEQGDVQSLDQISEDGPDEFEETPSEREDTTPLDESSEDRSDEFEATPIEQSDVMTIDQLNSQQ